MKTIFRRFRRWIWWKKQRKTTLSADYYKILLYANRRLSMEEMEEFANWVDSTRKRNGQYLFDTIAVEINKVILRYETSGLEVSYCGFFTDCPVPVWAKWFRRCPF